MASHSFTITSPLTVQDAFARLVDLERVPEWDEGVASSVRIERPARRVPSTACSGRRSLRRDRHRLRRVPDLGGVRDHRGRRTPPLRDGRRERRVPCRRHPRAGSDGERLRAGVPRHARTARRRIRHSHPANWTRCSRSSRRWPKSASGASSTATGDATAQLRMRGIQLGRSTSGVEPVEGGPSSAAQRAYPAVGQVHAVVGFVRAGARLIRRRTLDADRGPRAHGPRRLDGSRHWWRSLLRSSRRSAAPSGARPGVPGDSASIAVTSSFSRSAVHSGVRPWNTSLTPERTNTAPGCARTTSPASRVSCSVV